MTDLQDALDKYDRVGRGLNSLPASEMVLIVEAARLVANGIPTPFCETHGRTVPPTTFIEHGSHHSQTEGCRIVDALIVARALTPGTTK